MKLHTGAFPLLHSRSSGAIQAGDSEDEDDEASKVPEVPLVWREAEEPEGGDFFTEDDYERYSVAHMHCQSFVRNPAVAESADEGAPPPGGDPKGQPHTPSKPR
eukprot:CAMPEP_0182873096 /NCGR_PEP_ID=MMETSP0034_2-20130328/12113_1 /TAXON_ID=156128 /ORGANISM="Nephroselmis pyriformis, Strain CCMP717" /LENGTH=103 /DNA_ID=CAMNT_0025005721 /DNA_START=76 /DNA_END=383 /DNA_ORIENTATION=+